MVAQVYLIPGFMEFHSLGSLSYFRRVPELLTQLLAERGLTDTVVRECPTFPAASIGRRAERELAYIADCGGQTADSIHIIGHSTGGLDARLLATPGVRLLPGTVEREIGARIRSVITMCTPHFGAPLADVLLSIPFRRSAEYLGLFGGSNRGRLALLGLSRILQVIAHADDWLGRKDTALDWFAFNLLKKVTGSAEDPVWEFMTEMGKDQGALIQLTMPSLHLFNAAVADRPDTRYSSVIAVSPPPSLRWPRGEAVTVAGLASRAAYWTLYAIASRATHWYPYTSLEIEQVNLARTSAPLPITKTSSDGVVACRSQAYGRILDVVLGDHLDVVGHFPHADGDPHADWLPSGARFDEASFRRVWSLVAQEIVEAEARQQAPAAEPRSRAAEDGALQPTG